MGIMEEEEEAFLDCEDEEDEEEAEFAVAQTSRCAAIARWTAKVAALAVGTWLLWLFVLFILTTLCPPFISLAGGSYTCRLASSGELPRIISRIDVWPLLGGYLSETDTLRADRARVECRIYGAENDYLYTAVTEGTTSLYMRGGDRLTEDQFLDVPDISVAPDAISASCFVSWRATNTDTWLRWWGHVVWLESHVVACAYAP